MAAAPCRAAWARSLLLCSGWFKARLSRTAGESIKENRRLAVVYQVCQRWRVPVFQELARNPAIELVVLHSEGIPGTFLT